MTPRPTLLWTEGASRAFGHPHPTSLVPRRARRSPTASSPPPAHSDIAARWKSLEPILDGALDLAPAEREAYLDRMCANADTRAALAELLRTSDLPREIPLAVEWAAALMRGDTKTRPAAPSPDADHADGGASERAP